MSQTSKADVAQTEVQSPTANVTETVVTPAKKSMKDAMLSAKAYTPSPTGKKMDSTVSAYQPGGGAGASPNHGAFLGGPPQSPIYSQQHQSHNYSPYYPAGFGAPVYPYPQDYPGYIPSHMISQMPYHPGAQHHHHPAANVVHHAPAGHVTSPGTVQHPATGNAQHQQQHQQQAPMAPAASTTAVGTTTTTVNGTSSAPVGEEKHTAAATTTTTTNAATTNAATTNAATTNAATTNAATQTPVKSGATSPVTPSTPSTASGTSQPTTSASTTTKTFSYAAAAASANNTPSTPSGPAAVASTSASNTPSKLPASTTSDPSAPTPTKTSVASSVTDEPVLQGGIKKKSATSGASTPNKTSTPIASPAPTATTTTAQTSSKPVETPVETASGDKPVEITNAKPVETSADKHAEESSGKPVAKETTETKAATSPPASTPAKDTKTTTPVTPSAATTATEKKETTTPVSPVTPTINVTTTPGSTPKSSGDNKLNKSGETKKGADKGDKEPAVVIPTPSTGAYRPPSARGSETKSSTASSASAEAASSTSTAPTTAAAAASAAPSVEDRKAAAQNENVSHPPGVLTYSREVLMSFMKHNNPPQVLKHALNTFGNAIDRNSTGQPTRGGGPRGKSGGKNKGGADKPKPTPMRPTLDPASKEAKARTFRSILNKLTPENFGKLVASLLAVEIADLDTLVVLVDILAENAFREIKFCAMYADLCFAIAEKIPVFETPELGVQKFRHVLLKTCQTAFAGRQPVQPVPATITDPEERSEWEIKQNKIRGNTLGLFKFIGELANKKVLAAQVATNCLDELWEARLGYDDLELYCILLSTAGLSLSQSVKPEVAAYVEKSIAKCKAWIAKYAAKDKADQDSEGTRIRYLMQDVVDLHKNNWVVRTISVAASGPKTLDQIKQDLDAKALKQEKELKELSKNKGRPMFASKEPPRTPSRGPNAPMSLTPTRGGPGGSMSPVSPSFLQGGRGKGGSFTGQLGASSPARGPSPAMGVPSPSQSALEMSMTNAFDSLSRSVDTYDSSYLNASSSSMTEEEATVDESSMTELVDEFLDAGEAGETADTLAEQAAVAQSCKFFVFKMFMTTLEKNNTRMREWSVEMLQSMSRHEDLNDTETTIVPGLAQTIESLGDIDLPKAPGLMGIMLAKALFNKAIAPNVLNKVLEPLKNDTPQRATDLIVALWNQIIEMAGPQASAFAKQADFNLSDFPLKDDAIPAAVKALFDTPNAKLTRGEDVVSVVSFAQGGTNQGAFKSMDFVWGSIKQILDSMNIYSREPVPEEKYGATLQILLSQGSLHKQIAENLATLYNKQPSGAKELFAWFHQHGLPASAIQIASNNAESLIFDPSFNKWIQTVAPIDTKSSKSPGKPGGKKKPNKKR